MMKREKVPTMNNVYYCTVEIRGDRQFMIRQRNEMQKIMIRVSVSEFMRNSHKKGRRGE